MIDDRLMSPCPRNSLRQHRSRTADEIRRSSHEMLAAAVSEEEVREYHVCVTVKAQRQTLGLGFQYSRPARAVELTLTRR